MNAFEKLIKLLNETGDILDKALENLKTATAEMERASETLGKIEELDVGAN